MKKVKQDIFIYGASGHAKVVIDIVEKQQLYSIKFIVDDNQHLKGKNFFGYPVLGGRQEILKGNCLPNRAIVAIGENRARCEVGAWLEQQHIFLETAAHPSAQLGRELFVGAGSVFMANAVVNSATSIGNNCIINTGATIDHDCFLEEGVHIAPGCTLCGTVQVGFRSFIGAGSTVIQNIKIGKRVFVGAGTTVYKDVPDGANIVGF